MKYRLPKNCARVVHDGALLEAAPDGSVEAEEASAPALLAHGVVPWTDAHRAADPPRPRLGEVETMSRHAMIQALTALGHTSLPTSTDELRRALRRALRPS